MNTSSTNIAKSYDFVVVGGGTSGLTVASRLSEDSRVSVLVLEAGGDHLADPRVNIPALCLQAPGSELDWQFITESQVSHSYCPIHTQITLMVLAGAIKGSQDPPATRSTPWGLQWDQQSGFHLSFLDWHRCLG